MNGLRTRLLNWLWYVHPVEIFTVQATPDECLRVIAQAAKPSLHRLHLRNLFADGRRYYLDPLKDGFWMTSNSKIPWRRRSRTSFAAVVYAEVSLLSEGTTRINLYARMRLVYLVDIFVVPLFISSIMIFSPWSKVVVAGLAALLFGLSWVWHRLTAMIQAADMVYFVQKVLEDIVPAEVLVLAEGEPQMVTTNQEFRREWQKFYREHQNDG